MNLYFLRRGRNLRYMPCAVSPAAQYLSARHTNHASRQVGGTGTKGNMCRAMIFFSRSVRVKSSSAFRSAVCGWRNPWSRCP